MLDPLSNDLITIQKISFFSKINSWEKIFQVIFVHVSFENIPRLECMM